MGVAVELHPEVFSEEEYLERPCTGQREELIDGALLMSPAAGRPHQRISFRLATIVDQAVPADLEMQEAINVRLAPGRIVIPDIAVVTSVGVDDLVTPAAEVVMLVEIVSTSTKQIDRVLKPHLAAEVGIPYYVLVDPDGPTVAVHELVDGSYREVATASGEKQLTVTEPFPLDFRPADLLASRRG